MTRPARWLRLGSARELIRAALVIAPIALVAQSGASPLTDETRNAYIKAAEPACFDGQSKQEQNKNRKPEELHALCSCLAEKTAYTKTMEQMIAAYGKPFSPTSEEQSLMRAIFDNCWQVNVK